MEPILVHYDPQVDMFESLVPWNDEKFLYKTTGALCSDFTKCHASDTYHLVTEMAQDVTGNEYVISWTPISLPPCSGYLSMSVFKMYWLHNPVFQVSFHVYETPSKPGAPIWVKTLPSLKDRK